MTNRSGPAANRGREHPGPPGRRAGSADLGVQAGWRGAGSNRSASSQLGPIEALAQSTTTAPDGPIRTLSDRMSEWIRAEPSDAAGQASSSSTRASRCRVAQGTSNSGAPRSAGRAADTSHSRRIISIICWFCSADPDLDETPAAVGQTAPGRQGRPESAALVDRRHHRTVQAGLHLRPDCGGDVRPLGPHAILPLVRHRAPQRNTTSVTPPALTSNSPVPRAAPGSEASRV